MGAVSHRALANGFHDAPDIDPGFGRSDLASRELAAIYLPLFGLEVIISFGDGEHRYLNIIGATTIEFQEYFNRQGGFV